VRLSALWLSAGMLSTARGNLRFTDGVLDASNTAREGFGKSHCKEFLESHQPLAPAEFAYELLARVAAFTGSQSGRAQEDDITVLDFQELCSRFAASRSEIMIPISRGIQEMGLLISVHWPSTSPTTHISGVDPAVVRMGFWLMFEKLAKNEDRFARRSVGGSYYDSFLSANALGT
jgi:hypothetical protein